MTAGRIGGECRAANGAVELRLYADGRQVAEATDAEGYRSFEWVGLVVSSTSAGTEIRYDSFEADEID